MARFSAQFVIWGAFAEAMRVVASVYSMAAHARMKTRLLLMSNLIGASVSLILLIWLMPTLGPVGVGIALSSSGLAVVLALHFTIQQETRLHFPYRRLLQGAAFGALLMVCAELVKLVPSVNDNVTVSVVLLGVVGIFFSAM